MQNYVVKNYQKGFEQDQARIGTEVARNWIWPFAYDQEDLEKASAQPDFDPDTRHYCFLGDEMVGYMFSLITTSADGSGSTANLEFPRMVAGHRQAAELLMERAFNTLKKKGVSRVTGRVTTMVPEDIQLAEKTGFTIRDWGHKLYYSYEMEWGKLDIYGSKAEEINPDIDLNECAQIATHWYKRPADWCFNLLKGWHDWGIITHLGVRVSGHLVAACLVAPNVIRPTTAALYYVVSPDEDNLKSMLVKAVNQCVDRGIHNLIADLINEHRQYVSVYERLGFNRVAEWARCEKILA
jgi:hypothetical protein